MLLKDKVILVTGSTTGIGAAIARRCVKEGARVVVHGRRAERTQAIVDELGAENAKYVLADLGEPHGSKGLIAAATEAFGQLDSIVNNAGASPRDDVDSITHEGFDWIVQLNLRSPLFLSCDAICYFRAQGHGTIVNIGSINAYCGQSDQLSYAITKGGLMTMTRNLGNALGTENIRINQLNVGWTLTENESKIKEGEGFPKDWEGKIPEHFAPTGKLVRPEQVAAHAVFWASDHSAPANGTVYEVEQYPMIGRNLINTISLDVFDEDE